MAIKTKSRRNTKLCHDLQPSNISPSISAAADKMSSMIYIKFDNK